MADEERTPEDMRLVREIADSAEDFSRPLTRLNIFPFQPSRTDERFTYLVRRVEEAVTGGRNFLSDERRDLLSRSFAASLRVFGFYDLAGLPYVLVLANMENAYRAAVIVDVFSADALQRLAGRRSPVDFGFEGGPRPPLPLDPDSWRYSNVVESLESSRNTVERVDRELAARQFTTLFVDTLRGAARSAMLAFGSGSAPPTTIHFTVHSGPGKKGYALAAFPQHRYTPNSFGGSQLSTPVDDHLPTGHWCFEGALAGSTAAPIRDRWPHFVGPSNTSTKTTLF